MTFLSLNPSTPRTRLITEAYAIVHFAVAVRRKDLAARALTIAQTLKASPEECVRPCAARIALVLGALARAVPTRGDC